MKIALIDGDLPSLTLTTKWLASQANMHVQFIASHGQDFLLQIKKQKELPDIVITGIRMKIMDGCSTAHYIKVHYPSIKIIAFAGYMEPEVIKTIFKTGVDAYIAKGNGWQAALLEAISKVATGYIYLDTRLANEIGEITFRDILSKREKFWNSVNEREVKGEYRITPKEKAFLILNATSMCYKEIAFIMDVQKSTVETVAARLSKKLNVNGSKALALVALQNGWAIHTGFDILEDQKKVS